MGAICSKPQVDEVTLDNVSKIKKSDSHSLDLEKQLKQLEAKVKNCQSLTKLCNALLNHEDNRLENLGTVCQTEINEEKNKFNELAKVDVRINAQFAQLNAKVEAHIEKMTKGPTGKSYQDPFQQEFKSFEDQILKYEGVLNLFKSNWANKLYTEQLRKELVHKIPQKLKRFNDLLTFNHKHLEKGTVLGDMIHKFLENVQEIEAVKKNLAPAIESLLQQIKENFSFTSAEIKTHSLSVKSYIDAMKKFEVEFGDLSKKAESIQQANFSDVATLYHDILKHIDQQQDIKAFLRQLIQQIRISIELLIDITTNEQLYGPEFEIQILVNTQLQELEKNLLSYRQALEVSSISLVDQELQEQNQADLKEADQFKSEIDDDLRVRSQKLSQELEKVKLSVSEGREKLARMLNKLIDEYDSVTVEEVKLRDVGSQLKETVNKIRALSDRVFGITKVVELKKIELEIISPTYLLDHNLQVTENQKNYHAEYLNKQELIIQVFKHLYEVSSQDQDSQLFVFIGKIFEGLYKSSQNDSEFESLTLMFGDTEEKINELKAFLEDKGNTIESAEDAKHLMAQLEEIESEVQKQEQLVQRFAIHQNSYINLAIYFVNKISAESLIMIEKNQSLISLLKKFVKVKKEELGLEEGELNEEDKALKAHLQQSEEFEALVHNVQKVFSQIVNKNDVNDKDFFFDEEDISEIEKDGSSLVKTMIQIQQQSVKLNKLMAVQKTHADLNLHWNIDAHNNKATHFNKLIQNTSLEGKVTDYPLASPHQFQKKLIGGVRHVEEKLEYIHSEDNKAKVVKVTRVEGKRYQFGSTFQTDLKVIEDNLCAYLVGGYIPYDDFVRIEFLTVLEKDHLRQMRKLIKQFNEDLAGFYLLH